MSKRAGGADEGHNERLQPHNKRRKVGTGANESHAITRPESITSARQLQGILAFQQGAVPELVAGVQTFKLFLDSILYSKEETDIAARRTILREYLESQRPRDPSDAEAVSLKDLLQTWSFADSIHHDHLFSSTTAVIALLLKTLSNSLEFKKEADALCKSLLKHNYVKLASHGLSAFKNKTHVIAPALRLLTELVSFDGGAFARQLYTRRDHTFDPKIIARNLGISHSESVSAEVRASKPSIRSNTVRYLLANLKYQYEGAKINILKQGNILRALFSRIHEDPPTLVIEILDVIKENVLLDSRLPRSSKGYLMSDRNLTSIASLYRIYKPSNEDTPTRDVSRVVHEYLAFVCTKPDYGVLYPSSSWYPKGTEREEASDQLEDGPKEMSLPLDSVRRGSIPIKNTKLATFIQSLKPYSDTREQDLLLAIFTACPELVADYFPKKASFSFDPKLTATWMGYSSFLFSAVLLPIPNHFGIPDSYSVSPPPTSVVIENILPQPLSQKVLTRCLNQSCDIITFFSTRILAVAFQKLEKVLQMFEEASKSQPARWEAASQSLLAEFSNRCPKIKDVIAVFWKTKPEGVLQREAITRLLSLYFRVVPSLAIEEKFDISKPLTAMLAESLELGEKGQEGELRLLELAHLVEIASRSPSMKWWQKPDTLQLTPFSTLLNIVRLGTESTKSLDEMVALLASIVRNHGILQTKTTPRSLDALLGSLASVEDSDTAITILQFLDNCMGRFVQRPIKYLDDYDTMRLSLQRSNDEPLSMIMMCVAEQWPFLEKSLQKTKRIDMVSKWMATLINLLKEIGEDAIILDNISQGMPGVTSKQVQKMLAKEHNLSKKGYLSTLLHRFTSSKPETMVTVKGNDHKLQPANADGVNVEAPPEEDEDHRGLHRWAQKDPDEAVEEGSAAELVLCLCSKHVGIRREALTNLQKLVIKVRDSSYAEREQVRLLLNEVVETSRDRIGEMPLPYVAGVFAAHALAVVADPTHFMYVKINRFLNKGPSWRVGKIPSHWMANVLLSEPSDDDAYYKEVQWVLDLFFDSLRSAEDLNIYRARGVFERVLALYDSPYLSPKAKAKILGILSRASAIEGGSTTLITRAGIIGWIQSKLASKDAASARLEALERALYRTCDAPRVKEWSHGALMEEIASE